MAVYSYLLPFFLIGQLREGLWSCCPFFLGFLLFAIDSIAKGVENPFGNTINDMPMSAGCRMLENELRVLQGEPELPTVELVNGFLY